MRPKKLDGNHNLVRYVPAARLRTDEDGNVVGVFGAAFRLRDNEEYLSATWAEYFNDDNCSNNVIQAIRAIRKSEMKPTKKSGFAIGQIHPIQRECQTCSAKIRVLHEPEPDNDAHAALRGWRAVTDIVLERLAEDAWGEHILNADVPP